MKPWNSQGSSSSRLGRSHAGLRIDAHASGEIEGVPGQDGVARGRRCLAAWQDNVASGFGLAGHFLDCLKV